MKFHKLKFRYINSYHTTQVIDFDKRLVDSPIFLVNGPTGAGKSTILDAISLALFGATPRLQKGAGSQTDESVTNIITQGELNDSPFVELTFSLLNMDGVRAKYKATWEVSLTRQKRPFRVVRSIEALDSWNSINDVKRISSSKIKEYSPAFNSVLADLNTDDFQRLIILPQGQFDNFLTSDADTRAKLLAQLTNTDYYRKIGALSYQKRSEASSKLEAQKNVLSGAQSIQMDEGEVKKLKMDYRHGCHINQKRQRRLQMMDRDIELLGLYHTTKTAVKTLEEQRSQLQKAETEFEPQNRAIDLHHVILPLYNITNEIKVIQTNIETQSEQLEKSKESHKLLIPEIEHLRYQKSEAEEYLKSWNSYRDMIIRDANSLESLEKQEKAAKQKFLNGEKRVKDGEMDLTLLNKELNEQIEELQSAKELKTCAWKHIKSSVEPELLREELNTIKHIRDGCKESMDKCIKAAVNSGIEVEDIYDVREILEDGDLENRKLDTELRKLIESASQFLNGLDLPNNQLEPLKEIKDKVSLFLVKNILDNRLDEISNCIDLIQEDLSYNYNEHFSKNADTEQLIENYRSEICKLEQAEKSFVLDLEIRSRQDKELIRDYVFVERRVGLHAGEECPLCKGIVQEVDGGYEQHILELEQYKLEMEASENAIKELNDRIRDTRNLLGNTNTTLAKTISSQEASKISTISDLRKICERVVKILETMVLTDSFSEIVDYFNNIETQFNEKQTRQFFQNLNKLFSQLKNMEEEAKSHLGKWHTYIEEYEDLSAAIEVARGMSDINSLLTEHMKDREELHGILSRYIIEERLTSASVEETIKYGEQDLIPMLSNGVQSYLQFENLEKSHDEKMRKIQTKRELHSKEVESFDALKTEYIEIRGERDVIYKKYDLDDKKSLSEHISETDQRLNEAVTFSHKQFDRANRQVEGLQNEIKRIESNLKDARLRLKKLDENWHVQWNLILIDEKNKMFEFGEKISFQDIEEWILPPDELDVLTTKRAELKTSIRKNREEIDAAIIAFNKAHADLETKGIALSADITEMRKQRDDLFNTHETEKKEVNKIGGALSNHYKKINEINTLRKKLKPLHEEFETWRIIADIIGTRQGEAFERAAQAYNFQILVQYANRHLAHMDSPYEIQQRYDEDGYPTFDIEIRDLRVDSVRPTTTLSGGERFVVSLALALGLSDFSVNCSGKISFRTETLILDEGFGTLDQDSLRMTISALRLLHDRSHRQVGIISHVEALKEMVDRQIIVEKSALNQSSISIQ